MANLLLRLGSKLQKWSKIRLDVAPFRKPKSNATPASANFVRAHPKLFTLGALAGGAGLFLYALDASVEASEGALHPPKMNWDHKGLLSALDKEGVRRGYQVYKQVCSICHSLQYVAYRSLVGVCMTEAEAKAEAEQIMVKDGPDDEGNYYDRPGKLSDHFPSPYANEEAARDANNGSYPPDLSYIVAARKGGEDYIFALLTGFCDPPAGIVLRDGQHFNPYFPGGNISMGRAITNEVLTYEDENVAASASQVAKDVVTFLKWSSEPDFDERKLLLIKVLFVSTFLIGMAYYIKRHKWSTLKSRKIFYIPELEANARAQAESTGKNAAKNKKCGK